MKETADPKPCCVPKQLEGTVVVVDSGSGGHHPSPHPHPHPHDGEDEVDEDGGRRHRNVVSIRIEI